MSDEALCEELRTLSDRKYRDFNSKMIPGSSIMYGVRMPELRRIAKRICSGDWRAFLEYPSESHEHSILRALVIATADMSCGERLERTDEFIPKIHDWCVCDTFCNAWKVNSEEAYSGLWHMSISLLGTDAEFPMRVGAVMMMDHFLDE